MCTVKGYLFLFSISMLQMFNNNRALRSIQKNVQNKHKGEKRQIGVRNCCYVCNDLLVNVSKNGVLSISPKLKRFTERGVAEAAVREYSE